MAVSDLVAFLRARLNEDEEIARGEITRREMWQRKLDQMHRDGEMIGVGLVNFDRPGAPGDPARALAEVEAKRDILDEAELMVGMVACDSEVRDHVEGNRWMWKYDILWPLARVYADHPDFNPAWAPGAEAAT